MIVGEAAKDAVKRATKTYNLFCLIASKGVEERRCLFDYLRIKPVLQQISLLQVAEKGLQKVERSSILLQRNHFMSRVLPAQRKLVLQ